MDEFLNTAFGEASPVSGEKTNDDVDGSKEGCDGCPWQLFAAELARRTSDEDTRRILTQLALEQTKGCPGPQTRTSYEEPKITTVTTCGSSKPESGLAPAIVSVRPNTGDGW